MNYYSAQLLLMIVISAALLAGIFAVGVLVGRQPSRDPWYDEIRRSEKAARDAISRIVDHATSELEGEADQRGGLRD